MRQSNNPTAVSAVLGQRLALAEGRGRTLLLVKSLIMPVVLLAFAAYLIIGIVTMEVPEGTVFPGPRFFPGIIATGLVVFAALLAAEALRAWRSSGSAQAGDPVAAEAWDGSPVTTEDEEDLAPQRAVRVDWRSMAWVLGSFLAFTLLLNVLGWVIAAALLFWGVARGFGSRQWLVGLVVGLTVSSLTYIAFDMALGMSLPSGVLGWEF